MTEVNIPNQQCKDKVPVSEMRDKRESIHPPQLQHIIIYTLILVFAVWTSCEILRLRYEFRELQSVCVNMQKSESESYRNGLHIEETEEPNTDKNESVLSAVESELDQVLTVREKRDVTEGKQKEKSNKRNQRNRKKKKRKTRKKRRCKICKGEIGPRGPKGERGQDGRPGPQGPPGEKCEPEVPAKIVGKETQKPLISMKAVHFVAKKPKFKGKCISKWMGTCCQNYTYWSDHEKQVMRFFEEKKWTSDVPIESPLERLDSGEFEAVYTGVYLFYLNVGKYLKDPHEHIGLYVKERRILHCIDSIDVVKPSDMSPFFNAKEKTCSLMGLHYVKAGEKISLKIISKGTAVILKEDETYFGAVLLR